MEKQNNLEKKLIQVICSLTLVLITNLSGLFGQIIQAPRLYDEVHWANKKDSLKNAVSNHKEVLSAYELETYMALMHYPELKNTKIVIRSKNLKSTMVARPKGFNVFRRKGKRKYIIYINNTPSVKVPVDSVSFNAKIGVIGHELGHVLDYENKSSLKIIANGFGYSSKKFRAKFERATDQRTIDHGLGWQCRDWSYYVYHYKNTPPEYLEYKKKIYMSWEEIEKQLLQ